MPGPVLCPGGVAVLLLTFWRVTRSCSHGSRAGETTTRSWALRNRSPTDIEEWFTTGAADGFNVMPAALPSGLSTFVDLVVPILQERRLFRRDYAGRTQRDHDGLPVPQSIGALAHTG